MTEIELNIELTAEIFDEEGDLLTCKFNNDDAVTIDVSQFTYITLNENQLDTLALLIDEAKEKYKQLNSI